MNWKVWIGIAIGLALLISVGLILTRKAQEAFSAPSGAAHGWAIGVLIFLLLGIIGISLVFAWIRHREERAGASTYDG